jgi:hypothetical protein
MPPAARGSFTNTSKKRAKKQAFEMMFEHGKKIGRAIGLGCHPIWQNRP